MTPEIVAGQWAGMPPLGLGVAGVQGRGVGTGLADPAAARPMFRR